MKHMRSSVGPKWGHSKMLSKNELAQFQEDGYLIVNDLFSPAEVEALRAAADDPCVRKQLKERGADEHCVHLLEITAKHDAFKELARDNRITSRLAQLIGEDIQLQHSKLATKPSKKGAGAFGWHQDFAYFPHSNLDLAAVMVMLDDATPENGGMYAVKGSHKLGFLNHTRDGYFGGECLEKQVWEAHPKNVVPLMARAGGITIHHALTLHGSPPNHSGRPRRGVVFQYRASDAYQLADHVWVDTGFQVRGKPSDRVRCGAFTVELPKFKGRESAFGQPFGNAYVQTGAYAANWNKDLKAAPVAQAAVATV